MKNEELFEALSELDDELITGAKHIDTYNQQTLMPRRTPAWKIVTGSVAAAACVGALAVGGVMGAKYINGKNAVTPPVSNAADSPNGTLTTTSIGISIAPPEYPKEARYVYTGDYSELTVNTGIFEASLPYAVFPTLEELASSSELIVIGEFVDDPHQCVPPDGSSELPLLDIFDSQNSYNMFRIDKAVKGCRAEGEEIMIRQNGYVYDGEFCHYSNMTPMLKGDKWVYFLTSNGDGSYSAVNHLSDGRYPLSDYEFVLSDNVYGVFDASGFREEIYEDIKSRLPDWHVDSSVTVIRENDAEWCTFEMDEFPNVDFEVTGYCVTALYEDGNWAHLCSKGIDGDVLSIYLADLNGDGNREIITQQLIANHLCIRVNDFANKRDYLLEDFNEYNYELSLKNDTLYFVKTAANGEITDKDVLSLDVMVKEDVRSLGVVGDGLQKIDVPDGYGFEVDFMMSEFEGYYFDISRAGGLEPFYNVGKNLKTDGMYKGWGFYHDKIIADLYLYDINGDGYRELCSTGINEATDGRRVVSVYVYDVYNDIEYTFNEEDKEYSLYYDGGELLLSVKDKDGDNAELVPLNLGNAAETDRYAHPIYGSRFLLTDLSNEYGNADKYIFVHKYANAYEKDSVYSTVKGEVVDVGYDASLGTYVAILAEDGYYYYYSAMRSDDYAFVKVGDQITRCDPLGLVGNSGKWLEEDGLGVRVICSDHMLDLGE
ncbi:MAG: M23 family metallopeptidase [Lachnospiraceae bacterium]|nr:M23 family metallopeptidase [Ruminococcus sp.]MCM1274188.1 M23 family metallopeptidase [Lachnospiraceae bacterium]